MRTSLFLLYYLCCAGGIKAQQTGFVYIESEKGEPFYIRTRDTLYHSAPEGFMLLTSLHKLKGDLILGFPGQTAAAFVFTIPATEKDKGWVLKDMKQEGWRLYDSKLDELVPTRRLGPKSDPYQGMLKRTDAFAVRLSQVVNDSAVLYYRPKPGSPVAAASVPAIRLISKTETATAWILVYEVQEANGVDRIELEIPRQQKEELK
ncbi:hypothetical protein GCM10027036_25090 [Flavihumibacter cheonanensis]|jgi:hypothetical protein